MEILHLILLRLCQQFILVVCKTLATVEGIGGQFLSYVLILDRIQPSQGWPLSVFKRLFSEHYALANRLKVINTWIYASSITRSQGP